MTIKLSEAIHKLAENPGSKFVFIKGKNEWIKRLNSGSFVWDNMQPFDLEDYIIHAESEGEIIPAEPKVITFDEWMRKQSDDPAIYYRDDFEVSDLKECAKFFQKNGRLEMWLEFKVWNRDNCACGQCGDAGLSQAIDQLKQQ